MNKLRVGLMGLGKVAESHLAGYTEVDTISVVAGAEPDPERLSRMTAKYGFAGYDSPVEMLDKEDLDLVCVLAPPGAHLRLVKEAAARGVHVLCEKPLALSVGDCQEMLRAVERAGVKLYYGSSYRHLPACVKAKEMIEEGRLGKVSLMLESYVGGEGPEHFLDLGAHHYPAGAPGGGGLGLVDHGIHFADIMPWLAGSPVEAVLGRGNLSGGEPGPEYLYMAMENGAIGQLIYHEATYPSVMPGEGIFSLGASWDVSGNIVPGGDWDPQPQSIHIHGSKGALRVFHYANQLFYFGGGEVKQIPISAPGNPAHFGRQIAGFAESILQDYEPQVTGQDGLQALRVILAAYESAEKGRRIRLSD